MKIDHMLGFAGALMLTASAASAITTPFGFTAQHGVDVVIVSGEYDKTGSLFTDPTGTINDDGTSYAITGTSAATSMLFQSDDVVPVDFAGISFDSTGPSVGIINLYPGLYAGITSHPNNAFEVISEYGLSVPEPTSWALILTGLGAIGLAVRNSRRKQFAVAP